MSRFDRARLTAALLAVLLLSACADIGAPKSASVPSMSIPSKSVLSSAVASTTTPFIGVWNAVSADGITLIENFPVRVELSVDAIAATAGCRLVTNAISLNEIDPTASEMTGDASPVIDRVLDCSPELNALDSWLAALLTGGMRWQQSSGTVTLTSVDEPAGSLTLERILSPAPTDPTTFDDPGLTGSFRLSQWSGYVPSSPSGSPEVPSAGPSLLLSFGAGRLTAKGACGTFGGSYRLVPGALELRDLTTVPGECDSAAQEFDNLVINLLTSQPILLRKGDEISLDTRDAAFSVTASRVGVPDDPAFADTRWTLVQYQRPAAAAIEVPAEITATLEYKEGRISLYAGCNQMAGMAYVADGLIRAAGIMSTAMACGSPLDDFDQILLEPFAQEPVSYDIMDDVLTVIAPTITLTFSR